MAIADRIVVMNAGRIEDQGPPERVYLRPATRFAAGFMGEINLIEARSLGGGRVETPLGAVAAAAFAALPAGQAVTLGIRPEHLARAGGAPLGEAVIRDEAFVGTHHRVQVVPQAAPDMVLVAHLPQGADARPGGQVRLSLDPDAVVTLEG